MRHLLVVFLLALSAGWAAQVGAQSVQGDLATLHYKQGVDQMRSESWDEAAEEFKLAAGLDPHMAMAYYNLGQCRMAQKRYVEAVAAYKACKESFASLSALSDREKAERERARRDEITELRDSLNRVGSIAKGDQSYEQQMRTRIEERMRALESMEWKEGGRTPMPAEFPLALGSAYFRQEKLDDAEREYKEAIALNPKLGAAHNNLAVICLLTGHLQEAETEMKAAEKAHFPVNPRFKDDLRKAMAAAKQP